MVYIHGGFLAFGSSYSNKLNWMKAKPSARLAAGKLRFELGDNLTRAPREM